MALRGSAVRIRLAPFLTPESYLLMVDSGSINLPQRQIYASNLIRQSYASSFSASFPTRLKQKIGRETQWILLRFYLLILKTKFLPYLA